MRAEWGKSTNIDAFPNGRGAGGRALTKILFLMGGQRGKGAIKLIIQQLSDKIAYLQKEMV